MHRYCLAHETEMHRRSDSGEVTPEDLQLHGRKLRWLQHERLCHLFDMSLAVVLLLFSVGLYLFLGTPAALVLVAIALVLTGAYVCHYFFLENTVQRWYRLYAEQVAIAIFVQANSLPETVLWLLEK